MTRPAAFSLLCGLLFLSAGTGQEPKTAADPNAPKPQRTHYIVKNADPFVLAQVVDAHFKGEATVLALPAGAGNAVLISGTPAAVPEVVKLLEQLDRKPRTIEVEVTVAEVHAKDWKESEVKADELAKTGQRIKLTATEGVQVSTQSGGSKPIAESSPLAPGGGGFGGKGAAQPVMRRSVAYRDVGTTVKLTARVGADDSVALDLNVQDSRVRMVDAGDETNAPAVETGSLTTKVSVPVGKSVIAQSVRTEGKAGTTVAVVIVTARVVPDGPAKTP